MGPCVDTGDFVVLYDEAAEKAREEEHFNVGKSDSGIPIRSSGRSWK